MSASLIPSSEGDTIGMERSKLCADMFERLSNRSLLQLYSLSPTHVHTSVVPTRSIYTLLSPLL